ncbi:MAG: sensor domain-containing diguanylate cyclase [Eubacteriales bacterium]
MCKGILYRFDINTRTLYRNEGATKEYNVPNKTENFPSKEWLDQIIHPDDVEETIAYGNTLVKGEECSFMVRMLVPNGTFEFHKFTFKPVHRSDGTVKEMIGCTNNIHNFTEAKKELENVNLYFSAFQELSDDMLYHVDIKTKTMYRTSEQANLLGVNAVMPNYPESLATSGVIHPEDVKIYLSYGESLLSGRASQAEIRMKLPEGGYAYRRLSCTPVRDRDGNIVKMFGRVVNVQKVRELEEQANYDALTNILNKRAVFEMVTKVIAESTPSSKHALFFMDLDDFKYVNDHLGHGFGDYLLSELGKRLSENIRQNDFAGRVGGDEFIVFLRDVPSVEMLMGKAKMMLSTISEDFVDGDLRHNIHGSIGVSVFPDHGVSYEELYNHADLALYSSKHKGKNLVTLYEPSMNKT